MKHVFQFIMVIGPLIFSFSASCSWITKGHLSLPREFVNNLSQYQSEEIPQENLAYYAFWCAEVLVPRMQGFIIPNAALLPTSYAATCTKILTHADSLDFGRGNESFLINGSHIVSKELDDRINLALLNVFFNYFDYDTSDFREPAFDALHLSGDKQTGELSATVKAYWTAGT